MVKEWIDFFSTGYVKERLVEEDNLWIGNSFGVCYAVKCGSGLLVEERLWLFV